MKQMPLSRKLIIILTSLLFAVYAAYNVFLIVRDYTILPPLGIIIYATVALMFAVFPLYLLTAGIQGKKHIRFLIFRRISFIVALSVIFLLKLRMIPSVIASLDFSKPYTVFYVGAYLMTQAALLILLIFFVFVLGRFPLYPRALVVLPVLAIILFAGSLALEAVLYFVYGIGLEANTLRTLVIRPVFYLGFICLSAYFLFPPEAATAPPVKQESNTK